MAVDPFRERTRMSTAGRANEVGSVFRRVVATYLAVHGLRGQELYDLGLPVGVHPISLEFEASDPTDDIGIRFSDGRRGYLAAKRLLSRGAPLRDIATGWAAQVETLGPQDLLVVAAEELVGPLRHLDRALRRRRDELESTNAAERECLDLLTGALGIDEPARVLDRVRVLHLPGSTSGTLTQDAMAGKLDAVVADGQGRRATVALAELLHRRAGQGHVSGIAEWVEALAAAGVPLSSRTGAAELSRSAARTVAVAGYRASLAATAGLVDLTLLADDLPTVVVEGLVDGLHVDAPWEGALPRALLPVLRRWRRALLVGQPGSGKSLALREVAAHCAARGDAPTPVLVSLPRLLRDDPPRLTIDGVVRSAVALVTGDVELVTEHLLSGLRSGHAVLLCDGLDECGARTAWMAQQLADLLPALHPHAGLVVATRASAEVAAERIGLPKLALAKPTDLDASVDRILVECAEARVADDDRSAWLASRRQWVRETKEAHPELLHVPLLAVLVALVSAGTTEADLVRGRAALLHRAVEESVVRWESVRASVPSPRGWSPELTTRMLLDGFVVLGRLLAATAGPPRSESVDALVGMLRDVDGWALPPSRADEVAGEVLRFWDEQVAVFVVDPTGRLTARSKVFAEVAVAMWAARQDLTSLDAWLREAIAFTDSDAAIALAADLDPRVAVALLEIAEDGRLEAVRLLAELATTSVVALSEPELRRLLHVLRDLVVDFRQSGSRLDRRVARDPTRLDRVLGLYGVMSGPWSLVELACVLPLPVSCREERADVVLSAELEPAEQRIARALCELVDATTDGRALGRSAIEAVEAALRTPLPIGPGLIREGRGRFRVTEQRLQPGLGRVTLEAARRLGELTAGVGDRLFEIAMHADGRTADRTMPVLAAAGVDTSGRWRGFGGADVQAWMAQHDRDIVTLLEDVGSLGGAERPSDADDLWSLGALADLISATRYASSAAPDFTTAFSSDGTDVRRAWLGALADAYGIDRDVAARQARDIARAEHDGGAATRARDGWDVVSLPLPPDADLPLDGSVLSTEQLHALLAALDATSGWIAWAAANVLVNAKDVPWSGRALLTQERRWQTRHRAALAYLVGIFSAQEEDRPELFAFAAGSSDADLRYAARLTIDVAPELDPDGRVGAVLARDDDLAVRARADRSREPLSKYWTCGWCRTANAIDTEDCADCEKGSRPDR